MCFTQPMSLLFAVLGLSASAYLYKKYTYASISIGYFALMELLQYFQFFYIDKCNNYYNKLLTIIGYIHICFQPIFVNLWFFQFVKKPNYSFIYLSLAAALLLLSRLIVTNDKHLCDNTNEPLCGKKTCTFSGKKHLAWNIRLRAPGQYWFTPSIGLHFFMWVIPVLTLFEIKPLIALLLTLPYFAIFITNNIHEQPAIWCFFSIIQLIITFIIIKFFMK